MTSNPKNSNIPTIHIAPSILAADFGHLQAEVQKAAAAGADRIHCDIMDGVFVPNISFGPAIVKKVRQSVTIPLDVHLMIVDPHKYIDDFVKAGADVLIVHAEACGSRLPEVLDTIKRYNIKAGVCVNPDKPVELFLPYLAKIDQVLIMTVFAGFGGQAFIEEMLPKIRSVRDAADTIGKNIDIEVDGGINEETARLCVANGANVLVAGSFVFGHEDYAHQISLLRAGVEKGIRNNG